MKYLLATILVSALYQMSFAQSHDYVVGEGTVKGKHNTAEVFWTNDAPAKWVGKQLVFTINLTRQTASEKHLDVEFGTAPAKTVSVTLNHASSFAFDAETLKSATFKGHGSGSDEFEVSYTITVVEGCDCGGGGGNGKDKPKQ